MKTCQNDHQMIVFDSGSCPLCKALDEISVLEDMLKETEENKNLGTVTIVENFESAGRLCYPEMCNIRSEIECLNCKSTAF